ncbi:hypothetical protein RND81_05G126200 [Saponaria officinalis]|uniref:Ribosomal protein L1 n=1 Tax=Saponaria officinalis TaxID=3572 RepID=A0AAW1KWD8_SAPOF
MTTMELQSPSSQPPSKVPTSAVEKAVTALLNWKSAKSTSEKPQLLPSDEFIYLVVTLTKIPVKSRVNAYKLPLPHPLYTPENSEFCLFVADETSKAAKSKIEEQTLPISKVIKLSKLKKEYKAYEQKRKLCDSYDLFLAEKKIVPLLPNAIGKWFYKKKKIPVPVELARLNWKEQIERVSSSAMLYLSTGSCSVVKVARATMEREEIVANVAAAIDGVAKMVPKSWGNVRSLHLKFSESVALPVYQKVPELGFKIGSGEVVEKTKKVVGEVKKGVKGKKEEVGVKVNKKKKMKGRIHEVNYMDDVMVGEDEIEGEEVDEEEEKEEVKEEVVAKKRKKGDVGKKVVKKGDKGLKKKKDIGVKKSKKSKVSV